MISAIATFATLIPFFAALLTHDGYLDDNGFSLAAAYLIRRSSRKAPPIFQRKMYHLIPHVRLLLEPSYGVHGRPEMRYVDGHRHQVHVYIYQRRSDASRSSVVRLACGMHRAETLYRLSQHLPLSV